MSELNWANGISIHNTVEDECCPDFSCCQPKLQASEADRKAFAAANEEQRESFLFGFLGKALEAKGVFIVNGKNELKK